MKKLLLILVLLLPFLGAAQDKVVNITIDQPNAAVSISGGATAASGFGLSDGAVNISVSGGTPGYTYLWSNGATSQNISGLPAGPYSVTVTDSNGCTAGASYTVNQPAQLTVNITEQSSISCFGGNDGELLATASGGVTSYSFQWEKFISGSYQNVGVGPNLLSQTAGQYRVTVTDANSITAQDTFTLNEPTALSASFTKVDVLCFGDNTGSIDLTISGGTTPYTISWLDGPTTEDRTNLVAGDYAYQITDANGCTIDNFATPITILQPAQALSVTAATNGIQNPTSAGASDGSIDIDVAGGTPNYTYLWSNGATTQDISGLTDGAYTVTATDANGCTDSETFTLSDPPPFSVSISLVQAILCNGDTGSLQANATGGVPNPGPSYDYEWFDITSGSPVSLGITTQVASGLSGGIYRVIATDNNSNTTSDDYTLNEPTALTFSSTASSNVLCFGGNDGSASVTVNGGTTGYTYAWTKTGDGSFSENTASISNLTSGEYNITVTDANSCPISTSFTITEPSAAVVITLNSITDVAIAGQSTGAIDINVTGGTPAYTYAWTKTGDAGFNETTQDLNTITAGEYTVVVTDANSASASNAGCIATATYTVTEPAALTVNITETLSILCFGDSNGELTATASGGSGGYTYEWFEIISGTPTSLGVTTAIISGLPAGEYQVTVTDSNSATISNTYVLNEPVLLSGSIVSSTDVLCFGESTGAIDVDVSGGTGPYFYEWFDTNGTLSIFTQDISNIPAGDYSVVVSDDNSCEITLGPITINQPASAMSITNVTITNLLGFQTNDGSITVTVAGGTPSYTYEWRVDGTPTVIGTAATINSLQAGDYELTLADANGCTIVEVYTVTEPALLEITSIDETNTILCFGDTTAELLGNVSGGVSPYQYEWYNSLDSATILSTTATLSNIGAGTYVLDITDANGIQTSDSYTVNQPTELIVTQSSTNVSCNGGNDGSIDITVSGGTGAYSFFWSNGANTEDVSGLVAGNYSVTVRDQNFCEVIVPITITEPASGMSIADVTIVDATGSGLTDGSISITVQGGTQAYTYQWADINGALPETTNVLSNIGAGSYFVTITDANGCVLGPIEYIVSEPGPLSVSVAETAIACFGETGRLVATANGGVAPYSYEWFDASNTSISTTNDSGDIPFGDYTIVVTDANSNQVNQTVTLSQPALLEITNITTTDVACYGESTGFIEVTVMGGTGNYIYDWSNNGSSTNQLSNVAAGDYTVTITDENNCTVTSGTITITEPPLYDITSANLVRPSGAGTFDGSITINITGGVSPYDYVWTDAVATVLQTETDVTNTSSTISGLQEGLYTITVTDANGCTIVETYNLANPGELLVSIQQTQQISCFGGNDGILEVITVGGAGGNTYVWYDASDDSVIGTNSNILTGVSAGSYYVIVSNAEGVSEQSAVFVVTEPVAVSASVSQANPSCFGLSEGDITVSASGGTSSFEYRYRIAGNTYGSWIAFASGLTTQITGLNANSYEVQVRDTNGCFYEVSGSIGVLSVTLVEPAELVIASSQVIEPTGFGLTDGSIDVTIQGGTLPYTYQWSDVNGVLPETTNVLSNIGAGDYTVLVTDANGCSVQQNFTVNEPSNLSVTVEAVNIILCNGDANGSIRALPVGGIAPYTYQWFVSGDPTVIGTSQLLENLGANTYYVIVTDANGNTMQSNDFVVTEPQELVVSLTADFVLCGDGSDWNVVTQVTGGTAPYTYAWSNSESTDSITNVTPGTYSVIVTDSNGCTAISSIDLIPPPVLTATETITNPTCFGGNDGSISIAVTGGTSPYSYLWSTGSTSNATSGLSAGSYQVTITDAKGCELIQTYNVDDPTQLTVDLGEDITLCLDQTITLDATIPNGTSYQWTADNGFTSSDAVVEVGQAGTYTVISTNAQGCTATDDIVISNSSDTISAEFLVSTQVFTDESFVIVDISDPIPDEIVWVFPSEAQIIEENGTYAEILIDIPGEYEIAMLSRIGDCIAEQTKTVIVIDPEDLDGTESDSSLPMILDYRIFPNPSDGNFSVNIDLREVQPASLKIFDLINNTMIDYRTFENDSTYQATYNLNVSSGVYFVLLETPYASQLRKIIIE